MPVAIRAITRLIDADDVNVTPAVGVDEYALTYDHDTAKFVLRAPVAAPDLSGYALLAGRAGGQTLYGGTGANDDITIHGTSDGTRTTSYVLLQPTAGNVGIGTSAPSDPLDVNGIISLSSRALMISGTAAFPGSGQGFYVPVANSMSIVTGGNPRIRIDSAGKVGINDAAPGEFLDVTGNANVTGVYKVDDVQVLSNRVIDARCADVANSGDATTDGLIDALRDAMIAHGLIAAA